MKFDRYQAQFLTKYFCCASCYSDLFETFDSSGLSEIKCPVCECENLVTKNTAAIKIQNALVKEKEIRTKVQMYKIKPWFKKVDPNKTMKELGF